MRVNIQFIDNLQAGGRERTCVEVAKMLSARGDWQTYFREEARRTKLPPKLEADIIARTPPGEGATLDDGTVWTVANGKVKRVR